ncbi:hypothetical protein KOW79_007411 [Hemibagrus wyckioides]|uniref:Uncharacterized protein n=1 Tax=Hemibagrus wyckioides TaxID=337641 RepID=A0A9D3NYJ2_9TELE|nr:hypothetical protein KOW79_007411 [Hemibagrus wyckioides]
MLFSPKFSLSNIHVKLTAKGLLRRLQLLSGFKKNTVVFQAVDKSKAKGSSRSQQQGHANGHPDLVPPETKPRGLEYYKALCEKKNQTIQQLKNSFVASNRRFEAIAVVVQNLYIQGEMPASGMY